MSRRRKIGLGALAVLVIVGIVLLVSTSMLASFGSDPAGERLARMERSPHFVEGQFENLIPTVTLLPGTVWRTIGEDLFGDEPREPKGEVPVVKRAKSDFDTAPASGIRAMWIGHASVLLELHGQRVLFDPVFSERCSPSTVAGPARFHPPPMPVEELPEIAAVVISHDHYDHLDMATIQALAPRGLTFVVPLGIGAHLERWEVPAAQIAELDWGESKELGALTLTAVPSRHYSGRGVGDEDPTLWASWVATSSSARVFFSGDTGYFDGFRKVGESHGPFDLTLLKIGAYGATWPEIHMTPEEAVQAHLDLRGRVMIPIHWGTFDLASHAYNEPGVRVLAAAQARSISIAMPKVGELVDPAQPPPVEPWWAEL